MYGNWLIVAPLAYIFQVNIGTVFKIATAINISKFIVVILVGMVRI